MDVCVTCGYVPVNAGSCGAQTRMSDPLWSYRRQKVPDMDGTNLPPSPLQEKQVLVAVSHLPAPFIYIHSYTHLYVCIHVCIHV